MGMLGNQPAGQSQQQGWQGQLQDEVEVTLQVVEAAVGGGDSIIWGDGEVQPGVDLLYELRQQL
jgi:hypothetical protein